MDTQTQDSEQKQNTPYPGPEAYTEGETLYGRDVEARQLYELLMLRRLVLLHSPSGAGKTSLIQAKLYPNLREQNIAIHKVRLNSDPLQSDQPVPDHVNRYVYSLMTTFPNGASNGEAARLKPETGVFDIPSYFAHVTQQSNAQQYFLYFDQFEEVFSLNEKDGEDKREFFAQLGQALYDRNWIAVFAIREEFVSALEAYSHHLPYNLSTHYRLERLDEKSALQAIANPVTAFDYEYAEGAAERLLQKLRQDNTFVEPVQLQIVCSSLWQQVLEQATAKREIELETVENFNVDTALRQFYLNGILEAAQITGIDATALQKWFGQEFIEKGEGTGRSRRKLVLKQEEATAEISDKALKVLEEKRLLREEIREDRTFYELTHDRLIEPILEANRVVELAEEKAQAEAAHQTQLESLRQEEQQRLEILRQEEQQRLEYLQYKAQQRFRRILGVATGFIAILIVGVVILNLLYANSQSLLQARIQSVAIANAQVLSAGDPLLALALAVEAASAKNRSLPAEHVLASLAYAPGVHRRILAPSAINSLAYAPTNKAIASADAEGVTVWSTLDGSMIARLATEDVAINTVAFSPDGTALLAGGADGSVILWEIESGGKKLAYEGNSAGIVRVAFNPNEPSVLAVSTDGIVTRWDSETGQLVQRFEGLPEDSDDFVTSAAFSPKWDLVVLGGAYGSITLRDIRSGEQVGEFEGHPAEVTALAFNPDGDKFLSGSGDTDMVVWDAATGEKIQRFTNGTNVLSVAFSPDGQNAIAGLQNSTAVIWDITTGAEIRRTLLRAGEVNSIAISPDEGMLAFGCSDGQLLLWDIQSGAIRERSSQPGLLETRIQVNPQNPKTVLFTGCNADQLEGCFDPGTGRVLLWDLDDQSPIRTIEDDLIDGTVIAALSPDGQQIVTVTFASMPTIPTLLTVWDISEDPPQAKFFEGEVGTVWSIAYAPAGDMILTGGCNADCSQSELILWNVNDGKQICAFPATSDNEISSVDFSTDGNTILTGSYDKILTLWKVSITSDSCGSQIGTLVGHKGPTVGVFSPDDKTVLSGSTDTSVILWDVETRQQLQTFYGHTGSVESVAFSSDGRLAVSASDDQSVIVWNVATGEQLRQFIGHTAPVTSAVFTPDGMSILSASQDQTYILWRLDTLPELLDWTFQNRYIREFTCDERIRFLLADAGSCDASTIFPTRTPYQFASSVQ